MQFSCDFGCNQETAQQQHYLEIYMFDVCLALSRKMTQTEVWSPPTTISTTMLVVFIHILPSAASDNRNRSRISPSPARLCRNRFLEAFVLLCHSERSEESPRKRLI